MSSLWYYNMSPLSYNFARVPVVVSFCLCHRCRIILPVSPLSYHSARVTVVVSFCLCPRCRITPLVSSLQACVFAVLLCWVAPVDCYNLLAPFVVCISQCYHNEFMCLRKLCGRMYKPVDHAQARCVAACDLAFGGKG